MIQYDLKLRGEVYVMEANKNGRYVRAEDALALERKVAELERELAQLRAMVQFADARINFMVDRRAHPRTVTVTALDGNTRELYDPASTRSA